MGDDGARPRHFTATCRHCDATVLANVPVIAEVEVDALRSHAFACQGHDPGDDALGALLRHFAVHRVQ